MTADQLAVVVVNHNGGDDVLDALRTVIAESPAQLVVIDNASEDGSDVRITDKYPDITFARNARNVGFAAAANQGIAATTTPYVFLLNPDALLRSGSLDVLQRSLATHERAGAIGALVRNPDGTVQPTKRAFPSLGHAILHGLVGVFWPDNPGTRAYVLADASFTQARKVDWVAGPAMALRRSAFDAVGGFDEAFFFFVEDVDLCKRLSDAGYEVWFEPGAEVTHAWGGSWTKRPLRFIWLHQRNLWRYVKKHRKGAWVLAYPFIAAGLLTRFALLALRWLVTRRSVPEHRAAGSQG